jgi:hypothetical protein
MTIWFHVLNFLAFANLCAGSIFLYRRRKEMEMLRAFHRKWAPLAATHEYIEKKMNEAKMKGAFSLTYEADSWLNDIDNPTKTREGDLH